METLFFEISCLIEQKKNINPWLIEHFLYLWASNEQNKDAFFLCYYSQIEMILNIALATCPFHSNRNIYLLRHSFLSLCLDHFDFKITPNYLKHTQTTPNFIKKSNQRLLDTWVDARPSKEEINNSPGTMETNFIS